MARSRRPYTKLTCPSPTTGARGLPRFHAGDEAHHCERLVQSQTRSTGEAQVVPFHTTTTPYTMSTRKERRSLQSATDNNGTPVTWTLVLFQQAIDRQDRTLQSRRTLQLYWNYTGDIMTAWYTGILHRTRTHRSYDDMPCRHPIH